MIAGRSKPVLTFCRKLLSSGPVRVTYIGKFLGLPRISAVIFGPRECNVSIGLANQKQPPEVVKARQEVRVPFDPWRSILAILADEIKIEKGIQGSCRIHVIGADTNTDISETERNRNRGPGEGWTA